MENLWKKRVLELLIQGLSISQTAQKLDVPITSVWRLTKELEREGRIKRICRYPAIFEEKKLPTPQKDFPLGDTMANFTHNKPSPLLPHRLGVIYRILRPPRRGWVGGSLRRLRFSKYRVFLGPEFSILAYNRKVVFWLLVPAGRTVEERLVGGFTALGQRARRFELEQGCVLEDQGKPFKSIEWCLADKEASSRLDLLLNLRIDPKIIAGSLWKFDESHKPFVEISKAPGGAEEAATGNAKILDWVLRDLPSVIKSHTESIGFLMELKKEPKLDKDRREVG